MPTVEDLGREIKARHPGEYDDLSDIEVGRRKKARFPGQFDHYIDIQTGLQVQSPAPIQQRHEENSLASLRVNSPESDLSQRSANYIQELLDFYDPQKSVFTTWLKRRKSESHIRLLPTLSYEMQMAIEHGASMETAIQQGRERRAIFEQWVIQNATMLVTLKHQLVYAEERLDEVREKERLQHRVESQLLEEAGRQKLDPATYLEVQKKVLMDEQHRLHERHLAADEIRMNVIADMLKDHQRMSELQNLIDNLLIEIAELNRGRLRGQQIDLEAAQAMIASRRESLEALEANKRGIQRKLREAGNGQELEGTDEAANIPGNAGQAVEEDRVPAPKRGPGRPRKRLVE
jgi:hypothetical protein